MLALGNVRLGVWVPNPLWADSTVTVSRMIRAERREEVVAAFGLLPDAEQEYLRQALPEHVAWLDDALANPRADSKPSRRGRAFRIGEGLFYWSSRPTVFRLLQEAVGRTSVYDRKLYITDGGHYDNLGLVEALRRRPQTIYLFDASNDAENTFAALGEAVATANMDLDCEVSIHNTSMRRSNDSRALKAFATGTARFVNGDTTTIHVVKALIPQQVTLDVAVYAAQHLSYPRTSTGNQLFGEFDLEAYRSLGEQSTKALLEAVALATPETNPGSDQPPGLISLARAWWMRGRQQGADATDPAERALS